MTVETTTSRVQYATNGTTGPWSVPFYFLANADLRVVHTDSDGIETDLVLTTGYSVTGAGVQAGGSVTTTDDFAAGGLITILRSIEALQPTDYADTDAFPAATLERNLDRLTMLAQQTQELAERAIVMPVSFSGDTTLPAEDARAGRLFSFDSTDGSPSVSAFTEEQVAAAIAAVSLDGGTSSVSGREEGTLTAGDTVIPLTTLTYTPGVDAIVLIIGGMIIQKSAYTETSSTSLTLDLPLAVDAEWEVITARFVTSGVEGDQVSLMESGTGAAARNLQEKISELGVNANDYTTIQGAIDAVAAVGAGVVTITEAMNFSTPIALKQGVSIDCRGAGMLVWAGSGTSTLIESPSDDVLRNVRLRIRLDTAGHGNASAAKAIHLHSCYDVDLDLYHTSLFGVQLTLVHIAADSTGGGDGYSQRNWAKGKVRITSEATVGTVLKISGLDASVSTYGAAAQVVTLNTFESIVSHDAYIKGIDIVDWCDNNAFIGMCRIGGSSADDIIGVDIGSGASSAGVYNNSFENLAVDTFGTQTGRIGLRFGALTRNNEVRMFHQDTEAEGGAVVVDEDCISYRVARMKGSTGAVVDERRGWQQSGWITLADDTATSLNLGGGVSGQVAGLFALCGDDAIANGLFRVSVGTSLACDLVWRGSGTYTEHGTGVALTGTTGNDARVTVRACADGKVYVENRLGYSIKVSLQTIGMVGV